MKTAIAASLLLLGATLGAAPALADQTAASEILFGKAYDDNVIAIQVAPIYGQGDDSNRTPQAHNALTIRAAQAEAAHDRGLQHALAERGIALHNVLKVITAGNGGKIVYYR
ncbi:hypothetical protein [Neorhizobium alkalisoli]|uniref:DUF541 domain-containing protein n=1 Tax=Neorhizobium alkalisoli TaxID=528178 RepID=A0A561QRQ9_9HYPH|nr:hypothetical protein [Neorhizobium alkalisoli]TWF52992.1 hypothetical protein FHW37_104263 [Neorhizobium alkalisoli]